MRKDTNTQISQDGVNFIKTREGLMLNVYVDEAGFPTIGYGHKLLPGENYTTISEPTAEVLLRGDLREAVDAVNRNVTAQLTQNQFDALVSLVFNIGGGAFSRSTLLKKLNAGEYESAAAEFQRWKYTGGQVSNGLIARRVSEAAQFSA